MNLRPRFFLLNAVILLTGFVVTLTVFFKIADRTVTKWGMELAENQLLYDKSRAVQSIIREITLARQMAKSPDIINWAEHQNDPKARAHGISDLETFRKQFKEGVYFIAFKDSGKYYYSNNTLKPGEDPYKYTLNDARPSDRWFYDVIDEGKDFHINVNLDAYLKVTKLWVDVVMKDNGKVIGVLGTGLDLDTFIKNFTRGRNSHDGQISVFTDRNGAVQVCFDKKYIDFASITKSMSEHKSVFTLFTSPGDSSFMTDAMHGLPNMPYDKVISRHVSFKGKNYLAGVSYIPELEWFEITLHDVDTLSDITDLYGIALAFLATLIFGLVVYYFALNKFVIRPILALDDAMTKLKASDYDSIQVLSADGEMGRLTEHFRDMSKSVRETRQNLENKVRERTMELDRLVKIDPMTELLNRRGMNEIMSAELKRSARTGHAIGILWIDIDKFKDINDNHGHGAGDDVIVAVAATIRHSVREYDYVARWGGDEFIVIMPECTPECLVKCGSRIISSVESRVIPIKGTEQKLSVRVSIGGYMSTGETADSMLSKADKALYEAKDKGRGILIIYHG